MKRIIPLMGKFAEVTLDANGTGRVEIGPTQSSQTWEVRLVSVVTSTNVQQPVFELRRNNGVFIDGTPAGDLNSTDLNETLYYGERLVGTWTVGDPGAVAQMSVSGKETIEGG